MQQKTETGILSSWLSAADTADGQYKYILWASLWMRGNLLEGKNVRFTLPRNIAASIVCSSADLYQ